MRIEEVTVSRKRHVNLGNFENEEILIAMKAEVDTTESAKDVADHLARLTKTLVLEHGPKDMEQIAREKSEKRNAGS